MTSGNIELNLDATMKALVFDGSLSLKRVPKPVPSIAEALVRVHMAGICGTDVEISRGYMDFRGVLGHEFVGTVESCDDPKILGTRVVGEINAGCGKCDFCARGLDRHCVNRTVLGILGRPGVLAEYSVLPVSNLIPVPLTLSDEKAVFTEPVAAALEILEQVKISPSDRVLVIGDGRLGLLVCMALRLTGCDLTLLGKHAGKMDLASRMGGKIALLQSDDAALGRFDVVVEASGHPSGWDLAVRHVRQRGTIVLKSTYHGSLDFNPAPLVIDEITVVGSRCGRFAPALRLMDQGLIDPTPLISQTVSLDHAVEAFAQTLQPGVLKVLVKMT
jgi:alcohol dehydrogenase